MHFDCAHIIEVKICFARIIANISIGGRLLHVSFWQVEGPC